MNRVFTDFANRCGKWMGSHWAFIISLLLILAWLASGPFLNFSNTWQLIINTSTTVATLVFVILVQNTQNRNDAAMHLKLDEVLRSLEKASDKLVGIESATQGEIDRMAKGD